MKKIIMILLVVFGLGVGSRAQAQMLNLNYQMSLPLGDQHDFISKMSFRGFSMDYHYFLSERLAVGASLGWNTLYKHLDYATGHFTMNGEKVTISGDQFRYLNVVPLMASVRYFLRMEMLSCYHMPVSVSEPTGLKCGWKWETCWLKKKAGSSLLPLKSG